MERWGANHPTYSVISTPTVIYHTIWYGMQTLFLQYSMYKCNITVFPSCYTCGYELILCMNSKSGYICHGSCGIGYIM